MRIFRVLCLLILLGLGVRGFERASAQAQPPAPLVVFIEEPRELGMASVTDNGPDGLTRLAEFFQSMGAATKWLRLRDPLPPETSVIVLVRPRQPLSSENLARLWQRVGAGTSLLLALEPQSYLGTRTENAGGGLDRLITLDQGVSLQNGILVEPWFTNASFRDLYSTFSFGYADPVPHPITDPARQFDLPIALWGARPLRVEPFGVDSFAWALVDAAPEYVETSTNLFPGRNSAGGAFELNLDADRLGRVNIAAVGENTAVHSRIAILGDGEFVQNGYGLALSAETRTPLYPGNYVIAQRLAGWLLHLPADQYPPLPTGMTWLALDGDLSDWSENVALTTDTAGDNSILALDITQMRALRNDSYLYLGVETAAPTNVDAQLTVQLDTDGNGAAETVITMVQAGVTAQRGDDAPFPVPDAEMVVGRWVEARLPLRLTGTTPRIVSVCLGSGRELAFPVEPDCLDTPLQVTRVNEVDPAPLRLTSNTVVVVRGDGRNRINVRQSPSTTANVLTTMPYGMVFGVIGRTATGNWVQVANASLQGWVATETLFNAGDLTDVPVTG